MSDTMVAKALGIKVIGLTGAGKGGITKVDDVVAKVAETELYMIQKYYLPVYHCGCLMLEDNFFGKNCEVKSMVAIVLVNFNGADDTIECISSLESLIYKDYQIIVVDNCSTDDSPGKLKVAQQNHRFILLTSQENRGFSAGNNIGIKYAQEHNVDYYWLLNNDTLVEPDTLDQLLEGFSNNSACGVTTGKIYYEKNRSVIWYAGGSMNPHTARTEHWSYGKEDEDEATYPQKVTFVTGCCMCISSQVIDKIGMLDESYFLYEEDAEYSFRICEAGFDIVYIPDAVIYHKVSASTGQASPLSQYYTIRNKYRLIHQHFKGINKWIAYLYSTLQMFFRCFKGELNLKYYFLATKAFRNTEAGKSETVQ